MKALRLRGEWVMTYVGLFLFSIAAGARLEQSLPSSPTAVRFSTIAVVIGCTAFVSHIFWRRKMWRLAFSILAIATLAAILLIPELRYSRERVAFTAFATMSVIALNIPYSSAAAGARALRLEALTIGANLLIAPIVSALFAQNSLHSAIDAGRQSFERFSLIDAVIAAVGALILVCEILDIRGKFRQTVTAALFVLCVVLGIFSLRGGAISGLLVSMSTAFVLLLAWYGGDRGVILDSTEGLDEDGMMQFRNERIGEVTINSTAAVSAVYVAITNDANLTYYFLSIIATAILSTFSYRLVQRGTGVMRKAVAARVTSVVGLLLLIHSTGGLLSPFVYLALTVIFAGSILLSPKWSVYSALAFIAYFSAIIIRDVRMGDSSAFRYFVFIMMAIVISTIYTLLATTNRDKTSERLRESNAKLQVSAQLAAEAKTRAEESLKEQAQLNHELIGMRSAIMNVLEDVEESKRHIESDYLRDSAIFLALGEGMAAADENGRIFLFNPAAEQIIGVKSADVMGRPLESVIKFFPEEGDVLQVESIKGAFVGDTSRLPPKLTVLSSDGRRIPVSGTVAPFLDSKKRPQGVVVAFRDVTTEREVDKQKSGFISIASHQLRTPLSTIRWFIDLLLAGDAGRLTAQQKEFLTDIQTSTGRMIALVNDLLNVSRIETGRVVMNPVPTDVAEFIESLAKDFMAPVVHKKLGFKTDIAKDLPKINIDSSVVRQAVANLIANAVNYTPEGGEIGVKAARDGDWVQLEVWDNGIGIPENQKHRLFERFFRGTNAVSRETVGSGLGLYISKLIVETAGGKIRFESEEGKGTRFFVRFPGLQEKK